MKYILKKIPKNGYIALYIPIKNPFLFFGNNSVKMEYPTANIILKVPPIQLIKIKCIGPILNNKFKCKTKDIKVVIFKIFALPYLSGNGKTNKVPIIPPTNIIEVIIVVYDSLSQYKSKV
jgi:hypothetical protein